MKLTCRPRKILLHLGYPKTGSTSIQRYLDKINNDNLSTFLPITEKNKNIHNQYKDINKEIFFEEKISLYTSLKPRISLLLNLALLKPIKFNP